MGILNSLFGSTDTNSGQQVGHSYKAVLDSLSRSQAVIEFQPDGTILTANENFCSAVGYDLMEIQGQHHSMFVESDYAASAEYQQFWAQLARGEFDSGEYKRLGKGGKEIWIQASYNPVIAADGTVEKVVKFASDITAAKLKAADEAGQIAAISKSQAVIEFELDGTIITANENFCATVGYALEEIQGQHHSMFAPAGVAESQEYKDFWADLRAGKFDSGEYKRVGKGGKEIWINASYNPIFDMNGKPFKVVKFASDITAAKQDSADKNGQIDAISKSQAVIEFELDGTIITANENFCATVGYDLTEIQGQHHSMFAPEGLAESAEYKEFWAKLNRGEFDSGEYKRVGKGGREIWINASYNPIFDADGNPFKVVKFASDITAQKEAEMRNAIIANQASALKVCQANVMLADNDFNIVYMNDTVEAMLKNREDVLQTVLPGFAVDKLIGTCVDVFHKNPAHQREMVGKLASPYKTKLNLSGLVFSLIASPWTDTEGNRIGTVVEWADITDEVNKQKEEQALAAENARIRQALDSVETNVMIGDAGHNIIYMNDAIHGMMRNAESDIKKALPNFDAENLINQNMDIFHKNPAHQRGMIEKLTSTYKAEINVGGRTFSLTATPIIADDGTRIGTVVEWLDRTDEVAIEVEIDTLIEGASLGDLTNRINEEDKDGFFLKLAGGLNQLVSILEGVINETATTLDALAHGNLTEKIDTDYKGIYDKLKRDANATVDKLTEVISRISNSSNMVTSGAEEIAQGNTDLSQRTEEQASSLEETASSMEEMTSTVRQNADNAKLANDLAGEAAKKAQQGGEVVGKAVESMEAINDSSKKINDIIGVIDEIAFQTNLLALNAAVEAARAGEQGRGFAVVAGEVRNLAQRSAAAAKEIKDLIRDSVTKVEDGTALVNQSGETLQEIVDSVIKVNQMISGITEASEEQSSGIEQVNKAVTQMDEMTQQNAALVEEASAASESMAEQARAMKQLLSFFSLNEGDYTPSAQQDTVFTPSAPSAPVAPSAPAPAPEIQTYTPADADTDDDDGWEEF